MDVLEYNIVMRTPHGYRVGMLSFSLEGESFTAKIFILDQTAEFQGSIDSSGNLKMNGSIPSFGGKLPFVGTGKLSYYAVHITASTEEFIYEIDGTAKRN